MSRRLGRTVRLGDAVERLAKPVARSVDRVLGTRLEHCRACRKRKEALNRMSVKLFDGGDCNARN